MSVTIPGDGEVRLGEVMLPFGKRIIAKRNTNRAVAWATTDQVQGAGQVWQQLWGMSAQTGLIPVLLSGLAWEPARPWDTGELSRPENLIEVENADVGRLMNSLWDASQDPDDDSPDALEQVEPFGRRFPGLAAAQGEDAALSPAMLRRELDMGSPARIGLVPADRPADVLPRLGWRGCVNRYGSSIPVAAVLRSWEDRFGAYLLHVGYANIRVIVTRPPQTEDLALRIAAEHFALCDESQGLSGVRNVASRLIGIPSWNLWWD
jgi:hypothetical protein